MKLYVFPIMPRRSLPVEFLTVYFRDRDLTVKRVAIGRI